MKIKMQVFPGGGSKVITIEGAGQGCRAAADELAKALGKADENSRETTADFYVTGETEQHVEQ